MPITIIDDGTTSNDNRLGAIKDIFLAIENKGIAEDVFVLAGDNIYDFSMKGFVDRYLQSKRDMIMVYEENDVEKLKKIGVAQVIDGMVISFEEKPFLPKYNFAVPPFYIYRKDTLPLFSQYLSEGSNPDAPGNFITWLCKKKEVYAYPMEGHCFDIGDIESYEEAMVHFRS